VGYYIWYSEEGSGRALSPPRPLLAVPNVTAHLSTASVPITVLLYNGPVLCGFNVGIKWLNNSIVVVVSKQVRVFLRQKIVNSHNASSSAYSCFPEMDVFPELEYMKVLAGALAR